jgi:hypothetical protein
MCGVARMLSEAVLLDRHAFHATVHRKRHTLPAEEGLRASFFVSAVSGVLKKKKSFPFFGRFFNRTDFLN